MASDPLDEHIAERRRRDMRRRVGRSPLIDAGQTMSEQANPVEEAVRQGPSIEELLGRTIASGTVPTPEDAAGPSEEDGDVDSGPEEDEEDEDDSPDPEGEEDEDHDSEEPVPVGGMVEIVAGSDQMYCVADNIIDAIDPEVRPVTFPAPFPNCKMITQAALVELRNEGILEIKDTERTHYDGITIVKAEIRSASGGIVEKDVRVTGPWNGRSQSRFVELTKDILLSVLGRPIRISVPHGHASELHKPKSRRSTFQIKIWSGPKATDRTNRVPERMWGIKTDCRDGGSFSLSGWRGSTDIVTDEGDVVAGVDEHNLYIYHDIVHHAAERELEIYTRILQETIGIVARDYKPDPGLVRKMYVKYCSKRVKAEEEQLGRRIRDYEAKIKQYSDYLHTHTRDLDLSRKKLSALLIVSKDHTTDFNKEFESLIATPKIEKIEIRGMSKLIIHTEYLFCTNPRNKKVYKIGKMRFEINMGDGDVKIFNKTRNVDGYEGGMHHPHIFRRASPCYGNFGSTVTEMCARYEFGAIALLSIAFIETVNTEDDAGKHIIKWPSAGPEYIAKIKAGIEAKAKDKKSAEGGTEATVEAEEDEESEEEMAVTTSSGD